MNNFKGDYETDKGVRVTVRPTQNKKLFEAVEYGQEWKEPLILINESGFCVNAAHLGTLKRRRDGIEEWPK